jgi:hypothetical protein
MNEESAFRGYTLREYVEVLVKKYLNEKLYDIEDCVQRVMFGIFKQKSGNLRKYLSWNVTPRRGSKDDRLLKAVVYNHKLWYLRDENKVMPYQDRKEYYALRMAKKYTTEEEIC